ncbi:TauD/TfdA dioxygenase family protein [Variovorax sp. N23]|uniref:TauD/TfdA dioxygenase family protein n=1 Tax=Variovorax sp. N23 TaxID=2980555 RepID=UPI0021C84988|nr:TauD/TfdA family dioxygenase [Variovorax sp. N23]MCU4120678.1 TauD/TfdA family dioxygenase [Variovorax sp. N23]
MTIAETLSIRKLKDNYGAEVLGVDVSAGDVDTLQEVVNTFNLHGAVLLRGQSLTPEQLVNFARAFGEPEDHTIQEHTMPGFPEIYMLSNREVNGKPIGSHRDGVGWHTDFSYKEKPVMCTMLYAVEVPAEGGDTLLADMCAAYDALPEAKRAELDGLKVHHSYEHLMTTRLYAKRELSPELKAENPDVIHPLIRTHPANGRKALWPSSGTVKGVIGMENPAGVDLVDSLVEYGTQDQFVYRHKWQVGDLLVWDNRCSLHTGSLFDDKKYIREAHRLWVKGDRPF